MPTSTTSTRAMYCELHAKTNFSFLEGASHPDELVRQAAEIGCRAVAITDRAGLAGIVRAHIAAKEVGIKLVIGAEIEPDDSLPVVLWATDRASYGRLCRLITLGRRRAEKGRCVLSFADVAEHAEGLLAGVIPRLQGPGALLPRLREYRDLFGDRGYLLCELYFGSNDRRRREWLHELSRRSRLPVLAAGDVYYHHSDRAALADVLTAIRLGTTVDQLGAHRFANAQRYLKTPEEMDALWHGLPEAVRRTQEVADRCRFSLDELRYEYPRELSPDGQPPIEYLARLTWEGAHRRYPQGIPEKVRRLLEHELRLIRELHYEAYFLTVWDLGRFARSRGILYQGRGSAANSSVCYCLGITAVDPDRMDLLFERFVSRERNEAPDIDIDFEHQRREEILQYLYQKYGRDRAGMTAEVITYRPRSAVRETGKALGFPLAEIDRLAKRIEHFHHEPNLAERFREIGLDADSPAAQRWIALTQTLVGFPRHLSQHTGGMVMTRGPLCELVPIENAAMPERTVIQWNKDDLDELGILKVDCLALGMLTAVRRSFQLIEKHYGKRLTLASIPEGDAGVYAMIRRADTMGVFQIESRAQMSMLPRLRPKCFYDLVIEVAIVRPGPIQGNMVHPYLRRRAGREPVTYPHETIRRVLGKTLGVPLFQEQAMRLAVEAAGFTPGEADQLRRAMGAWRRPGLIDAFRKKLIEGMAAQGFDADYAEAVFRQIRGFGDYGFPESHAASFALLVYVSAWLKYHYHAAFTVGLLNSQPMGFYAPAQLIADARRHGVEVRPADINYSSWETVLEDAAPRIGVASRATASFPRSQAAEVLAPASQEIDRPHDDPSNDREEESAIPLHGSPPPDDTAGKRPGASLAESALFPPKAVRLGFHLVDGLRRQDVERLVGERDRGGPFSDFDEFVRRTGLSRSTLARLSRADAFRSLALDRRRAGWKALDAENRPMPLFEAAEAAGCPLRRDATGPAYAPPKAEPVEEVLADYAWTGMSLRRHPLAFLRPLLRERGAVTAKELERLPPGSPVRVAGIVMVRQRPGTAKGITFVSLEDETGIINLIVKPDVWRRWRNAALTAVVLFAVGRLQRQEGVIHVVVMRLEDLSSKLESLDNQSRDFC
ncbi:MAG: hypothetical protein Kow0040_27860 [Thermogutta sp.]